MHSIHSFILSTCLIRVMVVETRLLAVYIKKVAVNFLFRPYRLQVNKGASLVCFYCLALQSPIEYQRRESKSNSLGRTMRPPVCAASGLRPHSSASMDRQRAPCLRAYNTSLPSLYLSSQGPGDTSAQLEVQSSSQYTLLISTHTHTLRKATMTFRFTFTNNYCEHTVTSFTCFS